MKIIKHPKIDIILEIEEKELSCFREGLIIDAGLNNGNKTYYLFIQGIWILLIQIDNTGGEI